VRENQKRRVKKAQRGGGGEIGWMGVHEKLLGKERADAPQRGGKIFWGSVLEVG